MTEKKVKQIKTRRRNVVKENYHERAKKSDKKQKLMHIRKF